MLCVGLKKGDGSAVTCMLEPRIEVLQISWSTKYEDRMAYRLKLYGGDGSWAKSSFGGKGTAVMMAYLPTESTSKGLFAGTLLFTQAATAAFAALGISDESTSSLASRGRLSLE